MKVKHEEIKFLCGDDIFSFYIRKIKRHWWSPWRIVMDGQAPVQYHLVNGEYVRNI